MTSRRVSIVVPTFREVANLPALIERIGAVSQAQRWNAELLIMDDDSADGSVEAVAALGLPWVTLHTRTANRGLSAAVLDGFKLATGDVIVCLDADLSHPPEKIPELLAALDGGADFALGSRYVSGGTTDDDWGLFRSINSRVATLLARPLTKLKDPMSGFFAIPVERFRAGDQFSPIGYKIGLELLIKCRCARPVEVPIHFADRRLGVSKLTIKEQLRYLQHVRRLLMYRYGTWSHLAQFLAVGSIGAVVNLVTLTAALGLGIIEPVAIALGIGVSFLGNFFLNRRFTFSYARDRSILKQFAGFASASVLGAVVNYFVAVRLGGPAGPMASIQLAAALGILAGAGINFILNRYFVFRYQRHEPLGDRA